MRTWLANRLDRIRGTGSHAPTVPPMDGTLRPNTLLEAAELVHRAPEPDNLAVSAGRLLFTSGVSLFGLDPSTGAVEVVGQYAAPITALATDGSAMALGFLDGSLLLVTDGRETKTIRIPGPTIACITDIAFTAPGVLAVCLGSSKHTADRWKHDLMELGASGRVVQVDLSTGNCRDLANGLAYPNGVAPVPSGVVVSEAWRHRLVSLTSSGEKHILSNLPGYPSRLRAAGEGGYWLTLFAPRNQLIELVLRQRAYRERMMREIAPEHWVAPTLGPAASFMEPLQGGAIRTHGIVKPWAPTRSYGLVVRLDREFKPVASYHSRADGTRHGVVSVASVGPDVFVASKGGNVILRLPVAASENGAAA